jgi:hypothetical protein
MVCVRPSDDVLGAFFCGGHRDFRRQNRPRQSDSENRVQKTGFRKWGSENGIRQNAIRRKTRFEKRDSKNGIRKIYVEKSAVHLSVCLAGQGAGQGRAGQGAGQGRGQGRAGAK